jgi:hypothetical protein
MTSKVARRSFGEPFPTETHTRSSSSTTTDSLPIITPSDSTRSPSASPTFHMPPRNMAIKNEDRVSIVTDELEVAGINGSLKPKGRTPLDRKQSTPMMPAFMVSAPGKVIVFGEHAVVHGKVRAIIQGRKLSRSNNQYRRRFLPPFRFDHTSSLRLCQSRNARYLYDSQISTFPIPGTLTIYHGAHFHIPRRRSIITT